MLGNVIGLGDSPHTVRGRQSTRPSRGDARGGQELTPGWFGKAAPPRWPRRCRLAVGPTAPPAPKKKRSGGAQRAHRSLPCMGLAGCIWPAPFTPPCFLLACSSHPSDFLQRLLHPSLLLLPPPTATVSSHCPPHHHLLFTLRAIWIAARCPFSPAAPALQISPAVTRPPPQAPRVASSCLSVRQRVLGTTGPYIKVLKAGP